MMVHLYSCLHSCYLQVLQEVTDATLHLLIPKAPWFTDHFPIHVSPLLSVQLNASHTSTFPLQQEFLWQGLDKAPLSYSPQGKTKRKSSSFCLCKVCDGSLLEFMKKTQSLGVAWLVFMPSAATCKTTVPEGLTRQCDRSACDHKHHWQDTQIFSVGMGTQAFLMLIKMLLSCPAGSRSDWIPHEQAGSHVISRSCFSYPIIWNPIRDRAQSCSELLGHPLARCSWPKLT